MYRPSTDAIRRRIAHMLAVAQRTPYKTERQNALRLARRLAQKHGLAAPSTNRAPVDPTMYRAVGALLLQRDHRRFKTVDLRQMITWLIESGYLVQLTGPGPFQGRYLLGPGEWPVCKCYSDGRTTWGRMITKRPTPRRANHWYLLPHPNHNDVRIGRSTSVSAFDAHFILSTLEVPALERQPARLHREYATVVTQADRALLQLHFPSRDQQQLYRKLAARERLILDAGQHEQAP